MPYINVKCNKQINEEKKIELKERLGKAIEIIPGKSEQWLMVNIDSDCDLFFRGSTEETIVFSEVKIFGKTTGEVYDRLTEKLCHIFCEVLGSSQSYVKYEEAEYWGYNGNNF